MKSFNVDDVVLYGTEGICKITRVETREVKEEEREYYVLKPVAREKTTIFVPIDNEKLTGKMRKALTKDEVMAAIKAMPNEEVAWVEDEGERIALYKSIIASGETQKVAQIIRALYQHKKDQEEIGKKAHAVDERLLKSAEALLYDEFAYALDIDPNEVAAFITEALETPKKRKRLFR